MEILHKNLTPNSEQYVMECTLITRHTAEVGNLRDERETELHAYLSKEVLEEALKLMHKVVE